MTPGVEKEGEHEARVVAEFQSGAANQVINHSEGKGPSKNRLMRSHVNQVQTGATAAGLPSPCFVVQRNTLRPGREYHRRAAHPRPLIAVALCARLSLNVGRH